MYSIIFLTVASFFSCLALTPLVRVLSTRRGWLDRPSGRKLHGSAVPRTGGIAIAAAYLCALGMLLVSPLNAASSVNLPLVLQLLPAVTLVFAIGLVDDVVGLRAWEKLLGQVIAGCLAYWNGVQVLGVAGFAFHGLWSLPLTIAWLVACCNAFNLIDGVDGVATGVGLFAAFTTLTAALLQGNAPLALATAPLVGALLAFLRYNFNPASIFLGDCGSLTIGFVLGCLGAMWSQKSATVLGMTAPLMALAIPLLDTGAAIVRRFIRRQPIFSADRNHVHHRLLDRGLSPRKVALVMYGACGLAAAFSIIQTMPHNKFHGLVLVVFCGAAWMAVQLVGYAEFDVARSLVMAGTFRDAVNARLFVMGFEQSLREAVTPDEYWRAMQEVSIKCGLPHIRMSLAGAVYENCRDFVGNDDFFTVRVPLAELGYVNFKLPLESSVRDAVAITSLIEVLKRSILPQADGSSNNRLRPRLDTLSGSVQALEGSAGAVITAVDRV